MPRWRKNGWKILSGKMVLNKEYLVFRDALLNPEGSIEVKWKYIKQNSKISINLEIRGKIEVKKLSKKAVLERR